MRIYDRFTGTFIDSSSLPKNIDLGRYTTEDWQDLTNSIFDTGSEYYIHQELLNEANHSLHELFKDLDKRVSAMGGGEMNIFPLIQTLKDKLEMNEFEIYLCEKIPHLEQICRQPHYLLQRIIEKVNVSRAKRIPSKSYQYLAAHTEDWEQKSIVNFKPNRVLNEELDLNFNIYENQLFLAFVERCLKYLNGRLKEVKDISLFIEKYKELLKKRYDTHAWFKKVSRNLTLIGGVYEDENYKKDKNDDKAKLLTTEEHLRAAYKKLQLIRSSDLFDDVNKRAAKNITLRDTNVLINHKHYRYVRSLWLELNKIRPEKTEEDLKIDEQIVIEGVRSYSKVLIAYIVKNVLKYNLYGNYSKWDAINDYYCPISMEDKKGVIYLTIGKNEISFVTVANDCKESSDIFKRKGLYVLSLGDSKREGSIISVSPYDADSVERVGRVIKEYILREYLAGIYAAYNYPQMLKDYVKHIDCQYVVFNSNYTYSYLGVPQTEILDDDAVRGLEADEQFKRRSRIDRDKIRSTMKNLVTEINENAEKLLSCLKCQNNECHFEVHRQNAKQLEYLQCECGFVLDSTGGHVIFKNKNEHYKDLKPEDWGMDYVEFDI